MRAFTILAVLAAAGAVLGGCTKEGSQVPAESAKEETAAPKAATAGASRAFNDAVKQCEELSSTIATLIQNGELSKVHAAAEGIKKIAETMPAIAQQELGPEMLPDVTAKAHALAATFAEIDEVADAGKKDETIRVHEKINGLIADLKLHSSLPSQE